MLTNVTSSNYTYVAPVIADSDINTALHNILEYFRLYITPTVSCLGIAANILSCLVLLRSDMNQFSSSHYLSAVFSANSFFLLEYLIKWLHFHDINIAGQPQFCQMMNLLENASIFLSNWYMVTFLVDRYISIAWPGDAPTLCTRLRTRIIIVCVLIVSMILHFNMSITMGFRDSAYGKGRCTVMVTHPLIKARLKTAVELMVNIVLPYVCLIITAILLCIHGCMRRSIVCSDVTMASMIKLPTLAVLVTFALMHVPYELYRVVFITRALTEPYMERPSMLEFNIQALLTHLLRLGMTKHLLVLVATYPLFRTHLKQYVVVGSKRIATIWCKCLGRKPIKKNCEIEMTYSEVNAEEEMAKV